MRVESHVEIDAPRARVWEVLADPANHPLMVPGVTRWAPQGEPVMAVGARFVARWKIGSAPLGATIEIVEANPRCDLAWVSVTGVEHRARWRLRDAPRGRTRVTFRVAYQAPGGLLGSVADRVAAPMVRAEVAATLAGLKAHVEGSAPPRRQHANPVTRAVDAVHAFDVLRRAGVFRPAAPDRLLGAAAALLRWGLNPAAAVAVSAARFPDDPAVIDERGTVTFRELHRRTDAVAAALRARGVGPGTVAGVLCRNHRGFVEASIALFKLGADVVYLNTGFSAPQIAGVCDDEGVAVLVHDADLADLVVEAGREAITDEELEGAAADPHADPHADPPQRPGRIVILTSGTTGRPKGAPRSQPDTIGPGVAILSRIPLRVRDTTLVASPLFHAWGFAHLLLGLARSSTLVLRRRFDPQQVLADVESHRVRVLVAVPVMLERLLRAAGEAGPDTSSLEVVAVSGSALSGDLAARFMDRFGDILYNLYGSTEVAWATIADPAQLRAAPGTAGTPPRGTTVRIVGDDGIELPRGRRGRIFVGNAMTFAGYTGGGNKTVLHGLVDTGDVGWFDAAGRLMVAGRSDDMIVSGGENVFPQEVEELLAAHPAIDEAAVVGVDDDEFGQRLVAFVVPRPGAHVSPEEVREHVRARLARYKVPREVTVVDELPRNPTGKVLKRALRERVAG